MCAAVGLLVLRGRFVQANNEDYLVVGGGGCIRGGGGGGGDKLLLPLICTTAGIVKIVPKYAIVQCIFYTHC